MKKNILITILLIFIIFNIDIVISSTKDASILFFNKLFISMFPFMILGEILYYFDYHIFIRNSFIGKSISKIFNINNELVIVYILSILTCTPNNAIYLKNMLDNKEIDIKSANKVLISTYYPSISFVIGTIGILMFNSFKIGLLLYLNCIFNNILIGLYYKKENTIYIKNNNIIKDSFINMIKNSTLKIFNNLFIILGNIIVFNIIVNFIFKIFNKNIYSLIFTGLFEITNSINYISILNISLEYKLLFISFLLNFNGLSIIFQSISILSSYKLNIKKILIIKLIFSLISSIIFIPILLLM